MNLTKLADPDAFGRDVFLDADGTPDTYVAQGPGVEITLQFAAGTPLGRVYDTLAAMASGTTADPADPASDPGA